ncbi:transcriptional regulator with XRE-family HTH domain [Streptacidiphilus sp. MAP12-20]|uniref:helix-turn-helix domain-containing protein n=1 Tax=Streptacidiphilus sp. MAP12-20 TaxID=3156299 RepID=UPI003514A840
MDAKAPDGASSPGGQALAAEELPGLGARLRERRLSSGLTLEAAAARIGLSPAHLSRLETAKRQPSLPVLLGLSRAYAVPLDVLLGEVPATAATVVRGATAEPSAAGGWTYRPAGAAGRAMQALRVHVPQRLQDAVVRVHPGEEWLYVLTGRLSLTLDRERHLLEPGDSAHFDSMRPHRLAADSATGVDLLFVHTLLQSPTSELCLG